MSPTRRLTDQYPTLATVAERAGVSRQTVSNALNNPELLREDTLERVQAAIAELGYTPNRAARQLRTRASHMIGLRFEPAQEGTSTQPGDTFDLDYSLIRTFALDRGPTRLQVGLAGYHQRQTTSRTGPAVTEEQSRERYAINAIGFASNVVFPQQRWSVGFRFFDEFANRASYEGHSFQLSGSVSF